MEVFAVILTLVLAGAFEGAVWSYRRGKVSPLVLVVIAANILMVMIGSTMQQVAPENVVPGK